MADDDEYDEGFGGIYDDGHWEWRDLSGCLVFQSDLTSENEVPGVHQAIITSVEFKDDLDLLEQQRFRKKFQRKVLPDDVILLQDIKDVVLFTAPKAILTPALINVLHLPITDRFIRALIVYCQYYLQISDEMSRRMLELQYKISTPHSDEIESQFRENLEDLRLLVAKEYCGIILGAEDFGKYHHMGLKRKGPSAMKSEAMLFESLIRISMQIVWLALGRKLHNQLELEIHRLFKSEIYNIVEHKTSVKYRDMLDPAELVVMFGRCLKQGRLTNTRSPLMSEVQCVKDIDYRMMGLGVMNYESLSPRLRFFERILLAPEECLKTLSSGINIGILGLLRSRFDTMLKEIKITATTSSATSIKQTASRPGGSIPPRISTGSAKSFMPLKLYDDVVIPDKEDQTECLPERFPSAVLRRKSSNEEHRKKWLAHSHRLGIKKNINKQSKRVEKSQLCKMEITVIK